MNILYNINVMIGILWLLKFLLSYKENFPTYIVETILLKKFMEYTSLLH